MAILKTDIVFFCFRIDLDYVPWDNPDASEFGHAEPAILLRLLELARFKGYKYHFFASNRTLRAFPASAEAALNDGHDLDWFCKHPEDPNERYQEALVLFALLGHSPIGMSIKDAYPTETEPFPGLESLKFVSALPGPVPAPLKLFSVETKPIREGLRSGFSARAWCDATKAQMRDAASRNREVTVVVRPQVLGKHDPKLTFTKEILELVSVIDLPMKTFRDVLLK